ncbi:MAG TPA: ABC transporter permease, partial [Thermoanaerobaculia bacterium]|nr:ABC transporter permease [Thermoanaerobaculia bacterium]
MRKMFAVLKREYLQAVRRKMFVVMTLLFPLLMVGMMVLPSIMAARGISDKRVVVIDGTGRLQTSFQKVNVDEPQKPKDAAREALKRRSGPDVQSKLKVTYVDASASGDIDTLTKSYLLRLSSEDDAQKIDSVFVIPRDAATNEDALLKLYSPSSADIFTEERLSRVTNRALQQKRLEAKGIDAATLEQLMHDLDVDNIQLSRSGEQKEGGGSTLIIAFVFGALLLLPSFIYGNDIMRGIVQEKSDRVVEVLISSMRPMDLLSGKITGVAAVGLTQIAVWLSMIALAGIYIGTMAWASGFNVSQFTRPSIFIFFVLFYVLAYLTYVCIYAVAGAVS